jgi:hypothetical protein
MGRCFFQMKPDRQLTSTISSLCGKLKSAWSLQMGQFGTRLEGLLPEIVALPSSQIDACLDKAAKNDPIRRNCLVPIAAEHLFHPSLHHRTAGWLEDDSLPFRSKVVDAIHRFRLREFAPLLNRFFAPPSPWSWDGELANHAALQAAANFGTDQNYAALLALANEENTGRNRALVKILGKFPQFDAEPYWRKWFREGEVVDEIGICGRYAVGEISDAECSSLTMHAHVIWDVAEQYGRYAKEEVFNFLIRHLDFDQRSFSSQTFSKTVVCRGQRSTHIIASLNGWLPERHEMTKESAARGNTFLNELWQTLRADPSAAFRSECPVRFVFPSKHKIHKQIDQLLQKHEAVLEEDSTLGYSLRRATESEDTILALHEPISGHWRIIRLSDEDRSVYHAGKVSARELFFRYSSRGALVAFHSQVLLNANDLENKYAAKALRKLKKREALSGSTKLRVSR